MCVCVGTKETVATITRQMPANVERRRQATAGGRELQRGGKQQTHHFESTASLNTYCLRCVCALFTQEKILLQTTIITTSAHH